MKSSKPQASTKAQTEAGTSKRLTINQTKYEFSLNGSELTLGKKCLDPMNKLTGHTFNEYIDVIKTQGSFKAFFGDDCYSNLIGSDLFDDLLKRSGCNLNSKESVDKNNNCISFLFHLKSFLIVEESKEKDLAELNAAELAAHVVKMFFDLDKLDKGSFNENIKLINRLYESYPNDPDIAQAYAGYMIIGKMITKESLNNDRISNLLNDNEGLSFKIDRMRVLDEFANNDLVNAKQAIDQLKNKYPNEAEVSYYLAAYYWKQGDVLNSRAYLSDAINIGQNCSYCTNDLYKDTLKRMASAKPKDQNLFSVSIGLNFDNI